MLMVLPKFEYLSCENIEEACSLLGQYGEEARALFPNSYHLVLAEGQHGPFDLENSWQCVHQIWADFLDAGGVEDLEVSCAEAMHRPDFIVDEPGFEEYVVEVLLPWSS